jgi:hypothetical protein
MDDSAAHPIPRLGHGGSMAVIAVVPALAMILVLFGRAFGPHIRVPVAPIKQAATSDCFGTPSQPGAPRELPKGYRFLWEFSGLYTASIGESKEATWVYNRSCADPDALYPVLVIRINVPGVGTHRPDLAHGRVIEVGARGTTSVYYDGWVPHGVRRVLCPGAYWAPDSEPCRWDAPLVNMLAVDAPGGTYVILGAKLNGIGPDELVTIARRLPIRGAAAG